MSCLAAPPPRYQTPGEKNPELAKNLVKLALFCTAIYLIVRDLMPPMISLLQMAPVTYLHQTFSHAIDIVFKLTMVFAFIALADLIYTRWSYADKQKMSRRELREELGVEVEPLARIPGEWPLKPGYVLQVWTARLVAGDPRPLEDHDELRWITPDRVDEIDWLDEDRPAVAEAARRLVERVETRGGRGE